MFKPYIIQMDASGKAVVNAASLASIGCVPFGRVREEEAIDVLSRGGFVHFIFFPGDAALQQLIQRR